MEIKMRRAERAISLIESREMLNNSEYGILSTISADGQPYGVPLNYCYIQNEIFIHCAIEGRKLENIHVNNKVSFCVVGKTAILPDNFSSKYESVIAFGRIYEVIEAEKQAALVELLRKYYGNANEKGLNYIESLREKTKVYKMVIESITGKSKK